MTGPGVAGVCEFGFMMGPGGVSAGGDECQITKHR